MFDVDEQRNLCCLLSGPNEANDEVIVKRRTVHEAVVLDPGLRLPHHSLPRSARRRPRRPGQQENAVRRRASVGSRVRVWLEPDLDERPILLPPEFARELSADRKLRRWFDSLSDSMRREIGKWVDEPKTAASRETRARKMTERLMQAMEGEANPPPVLRAAFARNPAAQAAWFALTPTQRRNHLLGIFYYETADGRQRRTAKAIEDALGIANRKSTTGASLPCENLRVMMQENVERTGDQFAS